MKQISLFGFIGRTMHSIMRTLEKKFKEENINLNVPQFVLLNILSHNDDLILEDLAQFLNKDKSAILRHVNYLENEHFIAKMVDKNDRRRKLLIPTKKGMDVLVLARKIEEKLIESLTINITNKDISTFKKVLIEMKQESTIIIKNK